MIESPWLVPVPIPTKQVGFMGRFKARFATRFYCLGRNWHYLNSEGKLCVIPSAFREDGTLKDVYYVTDGKSYPRIVRPLLNSMGIGLTEGLVHDFGYRYQCQILVGGEVTRHKMSKKDCDKELRAVGIETNNMPIDSAIAYYSLRIGGFPAWNWHRTRDNTVFNDVDEILSEYVRTSSLSQKPEMKPFLA